MRALSAAASIALLLVACDADSSDNRDDAHMAIPTHDAGADAAATHDAGSDPDSDAGSDACEQPHAGPRPRYPGDEPALCPLPTTTSEVECGGIITRSGMIVYSRYVDAWDSETLELVGEQNCSDNTREYGDCGQCLSWGITHGEGDCATRDPCAKFEDPPTSHTPFCNAIGSELEGWYWGDTRELIELVACKDYAVECEDVNTPREGWRLHGRGGRVIEVADPECHRAIGIALGDEPCGLFEGGARCNNLHERVYCNAPVDIEGNPIPDETGVCLPVGQCEQDIDCLAKWNDWEPRCSGPTEGARCRSGQCVDLNCE